MKGWISHQQRLRTLIQGYIHAAARISVFDVCFEWCAQLLPPASCKVHNDWEAILQVDCTVGRVLSTCIFGRLLFAYC
jgi:hypothetical protein